MNISIIGIDPGLATGIATLDMILDSTVDSIYWPRFRLEPGVMYESPYDRVAIDLMDTYRASRFPIKVTAMEIFIVTRLTVQTQDTYSLEVIGIDRGVKQLLMGENAIPEYLQKPSEVKRTFSKKILEKELGISLKGVSPHAIDALSHAAYWAHKCATTGIQLPNPVIG